LYDWSNSIILVIEPVLFTISIFVGGFGVKYGNLAATDDNSDPAGGRSSGAGKMEGAWSRV
jgi:hypothetical protein